VTSNYQKVYQYYCDTKFLNRNNKFAIILVELAIILVGLGRYSFIFQGTSTRRQRSDLFGLRVKLPLLLHV